MILPTYAMESFVHIAFVTHTLANMHCSTWNLRFLIQCSQ